MNNELSLTELLYRCMYVYIRDSKSDKKMIRIIFGNRFLLFFSACRNYSVEKPKLQALEYNGFHNLLFATIHQIEGKNFRLTYHERKTINEQKCKERAKVCEWLLSFFLLLSLAQKKARIYWRYYEKSTNGKHDSAFGYIDVLFVRVLRNKYIRKIMYV